MSAAALRPADTAPAALLEFQRRYSRQAMTIAGQEWRYRRTTPGRPVMLALPGALGTGDVFYRTAEHFADRFDVVTVGYPVADDAAALAQGLVGLLDHLGAADAVIVGSSLGGYLAQQLAADHLDRVRFVVLGNTFRDPSSQQARWPAASVFAQRPADAVLAEARKRLEDGPVHTAADAELRSVLLALVGGEQSAEAVKAQRLTVLRAAVLPPLTLRTGQMALIDDDDDPVIAANTREDMRRSYAACPHQRIPGGGHYPSILAPDVYHRALETLLAGQA